MKTYNVSYKLNAKNNDKYILISDLHGSFNLEVAKYIRSLEDIKYVIISGDLFNKNNYSNPKKLNDIKTFLNIIKETHKVIISLGNHDLWNMDNDGFKNFKSLEDEDIFPIFNETCIIDNNRFTSFVPDKTCYSYLKQDNQETVDKILDTYDSKFTVSENSKYIEHLVSHNPYHFNHNEVIDAISKNYDLIETGHFHDGWIPTSYLDKNYDTMLDKGIQELVRNKVFKTNPDSLTVNPKRNLARGVSYIYEDGYYVVLPNNNIYYYNNEQNKYKLVDSEELSKRLSIKKVPPVIISGAINTFLKLKMFYPYITTIELTKEEDVYQGSSLIKKI